MTRGGVVLTVNGDGDEVERQRAMTSSSLKGNPVALSHADLEAVLLQAL